MYLWQSLLTCNPNDEAWLPQYSRKRRRDIGPGIPFFLSATMGIFSSPRRLKVWYCSPGRSVGLCRGGPSRWSSMTWVTSCCLCLWPCVWPVRSMNTSPVSLDILQKIMNTNEVTNQYKSCSTLRLQRFGVNMYRELSQHHNTDSPTIYFRIRRTSACIMVSALPPLRYTGVYVTALRKEKGAYLC